MIRELKRRIFYPHGHPEGSSTLPECREEMKFICRCKAPEGQPGELCIKCGGAYATQIELTESSNDITRNIIL